MVVVDCFILNDAIDVGWVVCAIHCAAWDVACFCAGVTQQKSFSRTDVSLRDMKRIFVMQRPYRTDVSLRDMKRIFVMQRPYLLPYSLMHYFR